MELRSICIYHTKKAIVMSFKLAHWTRVSASVLLLRGGDHKQSSSKVVDASPITYILIIQCSLVRQRIR